MGLPELVYSKIDAWMGRGFRERVAIYLVMNKLGRISYFIGIKTEIQVIDLMD